VLVLMTKRQGLHLQRAEGSQLPSLLSEDKPQSPLRAQRRCLFLPVLCAAVQRFLLPVALALEQVQQEEEERQAAAQAFEAPAEGHGRVLCQMLLA
jgi:hypothetical protein